MSDLIDPPTPNGVNGASSLGALEAQAGDGWSALEHLARSLHARPDLSSTLRAVLVAALEALPGYDAGGVNLYVHGRFEPQQVLGSAPPVLDQLQQRIGTGPCIDASREQETVVVTDMAQERRWGPYVELALSLDVHAMLCLPLWIDDDRLGSLSLYGSRPREVDDRTRAVAALVATHASIAIAASRRADNLILGMAGRDLIGQAKGILMERYRITADAAFELIRSASMATQLKVQAVAGHLVDTGELPLPR
ncbi:MAG TPA: GAF and ANTAR domain-containing protein [Jatrophihabitans sp.]